MKLVCIGDCGVDFYPSLNRELCGGITFNFAHQARARFSQTWEIEVITALGDDTAAESVMRALRQRALGLHVSRSPGATSRQEIEILPNGEKHFIDYQAGVLTEFRMGDEERQLIATADLMVTPHYQQIEDLFFSVMQCPSPGLRAVDFADYSQHPSLSLLESCIEEIDIGFFGLQREQTAVISELKELSQRHEKLFILTLGAAGSLAFHAQREFYQEAIAVKRVVDTTGAGDSFAAGFLSRFCQDGKIPEAMDRGAHCAARTLGHLGATN